MPRKQRFKPSRKPQVTPSTQVDDRQEIHPDDVDVEHDQPARGTSSNDNQVIERERSP